MATNDSVAPSRPTIWHVRKARHATIKRYRTGHFDIYLAPWFDEVVADQIEFLRRTGAGGSPGGLTVSDAVSGPT